MGFKGYWIIITKIILIKVVVLFISFMFITGSFANGVLLDAIGPITLGRGGANIAHADNGILIYDNPAALARLQGKRIEGALDLIIFPMNYKNTMNDRKGEGQVFYLPTLSYTQNIEQSRLGMGFGVYNPAGFSTEYRLMHPFYGEQKYFSNASLTKLLLGTGWRVTDRWSFGLGFGPAYTKTELELPYTFQTGPLVGIPALINMEGDDWSFTWNLGVQWEASSNTTFGLAYICPDKFRVKGDVDVYLDANRLGLGPQPQLMDHDARYKVGLDFRWPQILGAGVKHVYETNHRFSFDVLWIDWSSAFNEFRFELSEGDNDDFNTMIGSDSAQDIFPLHWKESFSFRLGYEYFLNPKDILRFGYIYNKNPVPNSTLTPMIPGIVQHEVSLGYGFNWKNWAFNVSYLYAFKNEESVEASDIFGGEFNKSKVKVSAHFLSLRFQY